MDFRLLKRSSALCASMLLAGSFAFGMGMGGESGSGGMAGNAFRSGEAGNTTRGFGTKGGPGKMGAGHHEPGSAGHMMHGSSGPVASGVRPDAADGHSLQDRYSGLRAR